MATVTAHLPGVGPTSTRNRIAVLHPTLGFVTLTFTDPHTSHDNIGLVWNELARQQDAPLLLAAGFKLRTWTLDAIIAGGSRYDTSPILSLALLEKMANDGQPVTVAYSALESGWWQIIELKWESIRREPGANEIVEAAVTIQFKAASGVAPAPGDPPPPPPPVSSRDVGKSLPGTPAAPTRNVGKTVPGGGPAAASTPRSYTVKPGDTLWGISVQVYGTGANWTKIADANHLSDPRSIETGQVLTIP